MTELKKIIPNSIFSLAVNRYIDFAIIALLLQFYIVYVVWEGSAALMQIAEENRLRFTVISSVLLIACPVLIEWAFTRLTILLN